MYGPSWVDPLSRQQPFGNQSNALYTQKGSNTTYPLSYLQTNGRCQQVNTYQWGFSFLMLFVFMLLATVWAVGTYSLWFDAYLNSRFDRAGRGLGETRAMLDLTATLNKEMGEETTKILSNRELNNRILRGGNAYRVGYCLADEPDLPQSRSYDVRIWWRGFDVRSWATEERYWLAIWVILLVFLVPSLVDHFLVISLFLVFVGVTWTLAIGRGTRSRWLVFFTFTLVALCLL